MLPSDTSGFGGAPHRRPLHVFHVIDDLGLGGAETLLWRLVQRDSDVEHEVACLGGRDWYSSEMEQLGIRVHHLGRTSPQSFPSAILALRRLIRETRPSIVQGWLYRSNMLSSMAALHSGVPRIWSIHCSSLEPLGPAARIFVYLTGMAARWLPDFVINCSSRSAEVHAKLGYSKAAGTIVPNGYDPSRFFPDDESADAMREQLGIVPGTFLVGTISRWNAFKDIPNLLEAVGIASRSGVPLKCLLLGHGLDVANSEVADAISAQQYLGLFLPLGCRSDVPALARALNLHILSSASEAFPNAVAETMLSGTPNAVTDVGDSALMVGETGWIVPSRDPEKLAGAIAAAYREWRDRPADWRRRQAEARSRIAENFSLERMANRYETIWRQVAAHGQPQATPNR
jgi:glycosyltransferase involved in cell wall biosynthesis